MRTRRKFSSALSPFYDLRDITDMEIYPCLSICLFLFFLFSCCFVFCYLLVSEKNYLKHELIKVFTTLSWIQKIWCFRDVRKND